MRYVALLLLVLSTTWASMGAESPLFTYAEHSCLQSGKWIKISVDKSGVHKLTFQQLQSMGLEQPQHVKVFGYGGAPLPETFTQDVHFIDDLPEIPIYMELGADGIFNEGDYLLFYAQGPVKINYDSQKNVYQHVQNPYSTKGYYFLTTDCGTGKRIALQQEQASGNDTLHIRQSYNYFYHEKELINLLESGREWYGESFTNSSKTRKFTFDIPSLASPNLEVNTAYVGCGSGTHQLQMTIGDTSHDLLVHGSANSHVTGTKGQFKKTFSYHGSSKVAVQCTYQTSYTSTAYLDYIGIAAYQQLTTANQSETPIFFPHQHANDLLARYTLYNTKPQVKIWEVTQHTQPSEIAHTQQNDSLYFVAKHQDARHFIAVDTKGTFPSPDYVSTIDNQDLHSWQNIDMVIICPDEYLSEADRLARHHRDHDGLVVKTVTPQLIYNEFSSGTPDVTAYRLLMKMLYDKATNDEQKPKHLLFMGNAFYDNRGLKHAQPSLLSYQSTESLNSIKSYVSDDYYALLDDNEGKRIEAGTMDIGVGRLPVSSTEEAKQCVDKIIRYTTQSQQGTWRNSFTFLADDEDGNVHMSQANALTETLMELNAAYSPKKIWLDAYPLQQNATGATYPGAKEEVLRKLQEGTLVFTYVGHGGPHTLTSEQTITRADIAYMSNSNLGLWITATCDFSRYDNYDRSAGMEVVLNPNGGGIASFTTTRVVYSSSNNALAQSIYNELVPKEGESKPTLGAILRKAKNNLAGDANKLNFCLLGDPAITLQYPQQTIITDSINGVHPSKANLPALGLITIHASVRNEQNEVDTDFNGTAYVTLYDKAESMQTLAGKGNPPFQYTDYSNQLFSGQVAVIDGKIAFTFMVPKDINYSMGNGRITYYAIRNDMPQDAHGYNQDFTVGGNSSDYDPAQTGPAMRLYINSPYFTEGQKVNNQPILYAHLYDEYGINTIGAGIGHDIILKSSHRPNESINLNAYYQSSLNDYKNGVIRYPLGELPDGEYTLELKAWNLQNVSSTKSIHFVVEKGLAPSIDQFTIYPNPVKEQATLSIQYDRPSDTGKIEFFVYDLVGQCHWKSDQVLQTADGLYTTTWHLDTPNGIYLKPGLYLASVRITASDGTTQQKTKKIIVAAQ